MNYGITTVSAIANLVVFSYERTNISSSSESSSTAATMGTVVRTVSRVKGSSLTRLAGCMPLRFPLRDTIQSQSRGMMQNNQLNSGVKRAKTSIQR